MSNSLDAGFFDEHELRLMGIKKVGDNVKISKRATIVGLENIEISHNVRIDDFSLIVASPGWIKIGSYVHIAGHCVVSASNGVAFGDYSGLSHGVKIYSASDDYSGLSMTNPMVPEEYKNTIKGMVTLGKHVIVGAGSVILPGSELGIGCSVGALSLVKGRLESWGVYFGSPARRIKSRPSEITELEDKLILDRRSEDK